jgi:hypothetical protein
MVVGGTSVCSITTNLGTKTTITIHPRRRMAGFQTQRQAALLWGLIRVAAGLEFVLTT